MVYASLHLVAWTLSITISLGWVSPSVPQLTVSKQLITWGCFLSADLYYVGSLPLFLASVMGSLHSYIGLSCIFACSTRAAALCMPVASFGTAIRDGILCGTVVMARGVGAGAVGALWGTLLWLALLRLIVLAEGMIHLEELLLQLDVGIKDGSNEPALDFKLNGGIATIAYLCLAGKLAYPVYEFIDRFLRPLLDIFQFIDMDAWGDLVI